MNVAETILVFAGIPLAIIAVLALLTLVPGARKRTRYKSGQPWNHPPVWYEPHPEASGVHAGGHDDHADAGHGRPSLGATAAALTIGEHPHEPATRRTAAGGARGTW